MSLSPSPSLIVPIDFLTLQQNHIEIVPIIKIVYLRVKSFSVKYNVSLAGAAVPSPAIIS